MASLQSFGRANPEQSRRDLEILVRRAERRDREQATARADDTLVFVLAGGRGEHLYPLTRHCTESAVPFAGSYRLIDFTLSNCLHSQLRRICVLPQYGATSLEQHLHSGWLNLLAQTGNAMRLLPPRQHFGEGTYSGTADAVYQNLSILEQSAPRFVLILASDHLYRMDYRHLLEHHARRAADVTLACTEVGLEQSGRFGAVQLRPDGRVAEFIEKPTTSQRQAHRPGQALVSMGIYVFDPEVLAQALAADALLEHSRHDFGHDILPRLVAHNHAVHAHNAEEAQDDFYWRDIGAIDAYWEASMELLADKGGFDLYDITWPIYSYQPVSPPARVLMQDSAGSSLDRSLLCPGVTVTGAHVERAILSPNVCIEPGAEVIDSVLLNGVRVGAGARVHRAIIGEDVCVPDGYAIGVDTLADRRRFHVSPAGITVVADIAPGHLERTVDPYALDMAPMGGSLHTA